MNYMESLGMKAKEASTAVQQLSQEEKNKGLCAVADELKKEWEYLLAENLKDVNREKEKGTKEALIDRLELSRERIDEMAEGLVKIAGLSDPVGDVLSMQTRPNGLRIGRKRVPLGVVGIIYESRPNVTVDVFGLCFKTGNVAVLRGGSDAFQSNQALVKVIQQGLKRVGLPVDALVFVADTSRETATEMMRLNQSIDVLIPRGGAGLIASVVKNSTVPVIETGTGNCHVYVDEYADLNMALEIVNNAKTQRMGVCNACESLVVHQAVVEKFLPMLYNRLREPRIELRGDEAAVRILPEIVPATDDDWGTEYLDGILSVKTVADIETAIRHINRYNTGHSETIVTNHYEHALRFQDEIDAAAVYVNASTRFTDGYEFGFGAEIGISTQKLHARGPMGLEALTTIKYIIFGNGQIRK